MIDDSYADFADVPATVPPPPPGLGFEYQDYLGVSIRLGSPEDFRSASYGEVKKPETINYRTFRPEKDGLFCERIFGPERDFECHCGKYRGQKHMGIVCDKCGVMVTTSRERRKRMGHISLAAPVAHIWFFSVTPSRIGNLLGMKKTELERVIYFQDYVVVDPGESDFQVCQLITEDEYRRARAQYGTSFHAGMGAEAIGELLRGLNLDTLAVKLREEMKSCSSRQRLADIIKRLRTVEMLKDSPNDPAWMVLDVIPVIPPELRPLVRLDSGNFASSDLNDLYRRLINRNNRLKRLIELNAPEVIIRNEKRMLQQSVDALFDNGRCKRQVMSTSNQPLKSLTDMIKGKQGRFRLNLLGKRVDYSARSVIVVGPELKLHQCGLPKVIALELFQPFIIRRLKELKLAETIKAAKKMLERRDEEVWDILEEVIQGHPVLLNRAPTLHRMGIQAFEPVLIEGNAIQLHPLVCPAFNADFDGDQMAVHLPLSYEAQIEASTLMLSSNNIFSPSNGQPLISPHQDIILGLFFLTADKDECRNAWAAQQRGGVYASLDELMLAYSHGHLETHSKVMLRFPAGSFLADEYGKPFRRLRRDELLITTPGRAISNDVLPPGMPYYNFAWHKKAIHDLIHDCHRLCGRAATLELLDDLKALGFKGATRSGMSFAKDDMLIPRSKWEIIERTQQLVDQVQRDFAEGAITNNERYSKIIDHWTTAREEISTALMVELASDRRDGRPYLNPVFVMAHSGARGGVDQIRQLAGMRGLMAKPSGEIIETPIRANFREGLRVLEYFSSTHGARKGLADTALKTADSGYLTRKLADVAQNVVAAGYDCGTLNGLPKSAVYTGDKLALPLAKVIRGRVACDTIRDRITDELVIQAGELITADVAERIEEMGYNKIRVRSPLTCEAGTGVCRLCYGEDLARGRLVEEGLAVGIIAAQSIGEPGTQLTMRTFHIGGTASRDVVESSRKSKRGGVAEYSELRTVTSPEGREVVLSRTGSLIIRDNKGRELDRHEVRAGAVMAVKNGDKVAKGQKLFEWDPHFVPILAEYNGRVRFADVVEGKTMVVEEDLKTKVKRYKIVESKGDLHPQILLVDKDKDDEVLYYTALPENAYLEVDDGQLVTAGTMLAKSPPAVGGTQDITGGLPRVTELFEARIPKDPATMAEIDGVVELGEKRRGKRIIKVKDPETGETREHTVSQSKHLRVHTGDKVKAGQPLVDGPLPPQEILQIKGEDELQRYLVDEVQKVYRAQGVTISDKHIEIIVMQMLRKVQVDAAGDSKLLPNSLIDRHAFRRIVDEAVAEGKNPPVAQPMIMGITKASVQSDSFISAASFQETTKVLTEAALKGKLDHLLGLKENVILGNLIPAGTGCRELLHTRIKKTVDFSQFAELAPGRPDGAEAVAEAAR